MFICERCGFDTKYKSNLICHLECKTPCTVTNVNITREELIKKLREKVLSVNHIECEQCKKAVHKSCIARHKKCCKGTRTDENTSNAEEDEIQENTQEEIIDETINLMDIIHQQELRINNLENIILSQADVINIVRGYLQNIGFVNNTASTSNNIASKKKKKAKIPQSLRIATWNKYVGEEHGKTKCLCCKSVSITVFNFHCAHVISEAKGGSLTLDNLRPVCCSCNLSMGTQNLYEYSNTHFDTKKE